MGRKLFSSLTIILTYLLVTGSLNSATINVTLYAESGTLTIAGAGGDILPAWGYSTSSGSPEFPGPSIEAREGDTVNITLVNNHYRNHNFVVKGLTENDQTVVRYQDNYTYSFIADKAGTYLYADTLDNNINRAMGMYGTLIVRPADGSNRLWSGGAAFEGEVLWVVGEMDKSRWNDVAASGGNVNTAVYRPNYFIMNGMGGFDAMHDSSTTLTGNLGDRILARIVNGGQFSHSLHFHGGHILIVADDGVGRDEPRWATTVNVPPNSTIDVIYYTHQVGLYPMHIHTAQMETANGVYLNGVAAMISISP